EEEGEKLRPRLLTTTIVTAGRLSTTTVPSSAAGGIDEPLLPPFDYEPQPYNGPLADQVFQKRNKFLGPSLSIIIRILYACMFVCLFVFSTDFRFRIWVFKFLHSGFEISSISRCVHSSILLKEDAIFVRREWQANRAGFYSVPQPFTYTIRGISFQNAWKFKVVLFNYSLISSSAIIDGYKMQVVYFVNSGTEANELAMLMACLYSGSLDMISLRNAYHGGSSNTIGLTALNTWKYPIPQIFGSDANSYAKDVQDHIDYGTSGKVAGFISETIQGVGGAVELAPGYLKLVYDIVCKAGGVCIADEVQTGFGRTGSHYWGFETQDVIPDIVTMAKGRRGRGRPRKTLEETLRKDLEYLDLTEDMTQNRAQWRSRIHIADPT
ncbi:hypothetical protein DVH24_033996, partial [Malus domestica]